MVKRDLDYFRKLVSEMDEEDFMTVLKELTANFMYEHYVEKQEKPEMSKEVMWKGITDKVGLPAGIATSYIKTALFYCYDCNVQQLSEVYAYVSKKYKVPAEEVKTKIEEILWDVYNLKKKSNDIQEVLKFEATYFGHERANWYKPEIFILDMARRMRVWI